MSERKATGLKFDSDKAHPRYLYEGVPLALEELVKVLDFGAKKYAPFSWKSVPEAPARYQDASYRHDSARRRGEVNDPETGVSHRAHHIINELFLLQLELEALANQEATTPGSTARQAFQEAVYESEKDNEEDSLAAYIESTYASLPNVAGMVRGEILGFPAQRTEGESFEVAPKVSLLESLKTSVFGTKQTPEV